MLRWSSTARRTQGTRTTTEERSERRLPPHDGTVRSMRRPPAPRAEGDEEPCEEPCARAGRPATECVGLCALLLIKVQVSAHGARPGRLHCGPVGTCTTTSNIAPGIMVHQNKMGTWQDLQWTVLWVPATGKLSELLGSLRPAAAAPHHDAAVAHCQACTWLHACRLGSLRRISRRTVPPFVRLPLSHGVH